MYKNEQNEREIIQWRLLGCRLTGLLDWALVLCIFVETFDNLTEEIGMNIFTNQLESSAKEKIYILIMGDANLCSNKWKENNFIHKKIAKQLID